MAFFAPSKEVIIKRLKVADEKFAKDNPPKKPKMTDRLNKIISGPDYKTNKKA